MASQDFDATGAPQDVVAALSLQRGVAYSVQNVSTTATLFIRSAAAAPAMGARAFRLEAGGAGAITPPIGSTDGVYVWTDDPAGCPIIVDDAA